MRVCCVCVSVCTCVYQLQYFNVIPIYSTHPDPVNM